MRGLWLSVAFVLGLLVVSSAAAVDLPAVIARASRLRSAQDAPQFVAHSELVVLHVTVKDRNGRDVAGLSKDAFAVFEDGRSQSIQFFSGQDAPVTVGLLIDSSGSMQGRRDLVAAAAETFVDTSNPQDETFALAFNDDVRSALPLDAPFAKDAASLRDALGHVVSARGRTALYDAMSRGIDVLAQGHHERKILVVISDGADNASHVTFDTILTRAQSSNVVIYTVGLPDPIGDEGDPKHLKQFAQATGGAAFVPRDAHQAAEILREVALDIRFAYTLGYVPGNTTRDGTFRRIQLNVRAPDGRRLTARTRTGYRPVAPKRSGP